MFKTINNIEVKKVKDTYAHTQTRTHRKINLAGWLGRNRSSVSERSGFIMKGESLFSDEGFRGHP